MEDPQFTVLVTVPGPGGPEALRAVRAVTGLSLWRSRLLLDRVPAAVARDIPFESAVAVVRRLRAGGVGAAVRCDWCARTVPGDGTPLDPLPCASRFWPSAHCAANSLTACDCGFCAAYGPLRPPPSLAP
ncbi:hypothetical protein [Kitasatospora sp. NPDC093806]|uniref:hypothetical protein n=1 Tax=Kitasatospora sp. NPDC093806 TaxID=3155075 RepID=UPI003442A0EA